MEQALSKSWKVSHKIREIVWSTRQSLQTVISMQVQKDSFVLKFIMKLNVFNPSFMKNKSRFRKENETTCEKCNKLRYCCKKPEDTSCKLKVYMMKTCLKCNHYIANQTFSHIFCVIGFKQLKNILSLLKQVSVTYQTLVMFCVFEVTFII